MEQKLQHDLKAKPRLVSIGDLVFVKKFSAGRRWLPGKIVYRTGPVSFRVKLDDGRLRRYHQDQLRPQEVEEEDNRRDVSDFRIDEDEALFFPILKTFLFASIQMHMMSSM